MKKANFYISCKHDGKHIFRTVSGYVTSYTAPTGATVRVGYHREGGTWTATHIPSGLAVYSGAPRRKDAETAACDRLDGIIRSTQGKFCQRVTAELDAWRSMQMNALQ